MTKIIGIVPARMAASRFPGKPMHPILGRPMLEHVFRRAALYPQWDALCVATCDEEIAGFSRSQGWPVVMTADTHVRALDRVAEAGEKCGVDLADDDIVVCVQGDEPMLRPDMIDAVVKPFFADPTVEGTLLGVHIVDEDVFLNPDTVKAVSDIHGDVLYTSRAPIPYCKTFSPELGARRIGGIFAFRWRYLQQFTRLAPTPLEIIEACDSNRLCGGGLKQRLAPYPATPFFSVDSPADIGTVETAMANDPLWGSY